MDLSPKAFDLLALLVAGRPRVIGRAEIHDRLWPKTFVASTSLPRIVTELRKALGDRARQPRLIRTVHGHGYAFCGEIGEEGLGPRPESAGCAVLWNGLEIALVEGDNLIGRGEECRVRSRSGRVSRCHARIRVEKGRASLEDLGSRNGTFLGGRRLEGTAILADADVMGVGPEVLVFLGPATLDSTEADSAAGRRG